MLHQHLQGNRTSHMYLLQRNFRIPIAFINVGSPAVYTAVPLSPTVEACLALQTEEPSHFCTHQVSLLSALHTQCVPVGSIPGSFLTLESMMSTSIADCANAAFGKASPLVTFTRHMPRHTAVEAHGLLRAGPHFVPDLRT